MSGLVLVSPWDEDEWVLDAQLVQRPNDDVTESEGILDDVTVCSCQLNRLLEVLLSILPLLIDRSIRDPPFDACIISTT